MSGAQSIANPKDAWVERVLGVRLSAREATPGVGLGKAARAWRDASDMVDVQIGKLQAALRASGDEELQEIGEYGLNGVTGNYKVRVMAALRGAESGVEGDRKKLSEAAAGFRQHLESDERVEACDDNPFGVAVSIRATLIPALEELEQSLAG